MEMRSGSALLDWEAETHQRAPVALRQGNSFAQLAAEDPILLPEEIILLGEILTERPLDRGD
jgi:hypothetical protein